jgi:hypothetical protein
MKREADARPRCGSSANELGVRPGIDIRPDAGGLVQPRTGGLSTTPDDPSKLPPHVRPQSLGGKGKLPVFVLEVDALGEELTSRRDPEHPRRHAFIEPAAAMALAGLQRVLCSTRDNWKAVS